MRKIETKNMMIIELMDSYKKQIFEASVIYHKFEENLKKIGESQGQNGENEKIYMITKEFLDNFKNKINYNKTKDLFVDRDNEENFKKFEDNMVGCQVDDLEYIIFGEFKLYGDLDKVDEDFKKGFDFVNEDFLNELEFDFEENMKDCNVEYYKNNNTITVIFPDKSKLLINEINGNYKYNAIPSPIKELSSQNTLQKVRTFQMNNLSKAKTIKEK